MREDLIERLRERAQFEDKRVLDEAKAMGFEPEVYTGSRTGALLREAAAALEAAREDSARLDWLAGDAVLTSGWREHGTWETPALLVNSTRETCAPRDFRAAIDQARGKGGGEVEGG